MSIEVLAFSGTKVSTDRTSDRWTLAEEMGATEKVDSKPIKWAREAFPFSKPRPHNFSQSEPPHSALSQRDFPKTPTIR